MADQDNVIREQRLNQVIAAYLEAERTGQPPGAEELLCRQPDLAAELQSFFADRERFKRMAEPIPGVPVSQAAELGLHSSPHRGVGAGSLFRQMKK